MRLGAFNDDLHTDIAEASVIAADLGLDGLAVRAVGGVNIADLDDAGVEYVYRSVRGHGLEVASIGSQFGRGLYLDDPDAISRGMAHLGRALRAAETCGTPLVRVFAGWLPGQEALPEWSRRPPYPECLERLVDVIAPAARAADRAGVTLMFELEGATYVGTVAETRQFFAALGSSAVALCWDVCNGWWSGESAAAGLAELGDLPVVDIQTKDVPAAAGAPLVPTFGRAVVGDGGVGYPWLLPAMIERGYDGWITAERVHHPVKPEENPEAHQATLADITALKSILAPVGGLA
ncbi:MAG: sugar phosphate isomerase/epimerase [Propionibacteriaceae bacterium]|nr:sugar phosphate isomerase/epimerase [Propionibacteriaceae bacterium]